MSEAISDTLDHGITCIDAAYIRPGLACFYLLEQDGECAIIETGTSRSFANLQRVMAERGLGADQVRYVIPTHVHLDHAGGAGAMMAAFPQAELLIHPRGAPHMIDPERLVTSSRAVYGERQFQRLYGDIQPVDAGRVVALNDGDAVKLGARRLEFRHTRGHADHHFCVWDETSQGWFSGDMFGISYPWFRFPDGDYLMPATTPTQFDPQAYRASLELLASYQPQRCFLTHYGELAYTPDKMDLLARQIIAYEALALQHQGDQPAMVGALAECSFAEIRKLGSSTPQPKLRELLAFDLDLNAQGLQVWLHRRAK